MGVTATAAVARGRGWPLSLEEIELDDPRDDEFLLRTAACGVCHTDAKARDGYGSVVFPLVLGHEGAGTVVQVGRRVRGLQPGDRVLLVSDYCGRCDRCRAGQTSYCEESPLRTFGATRPDGSPRARRGSEPIRSAFFGQSAFATFALASERNALKVDAATPLDLFAATTCGMVTGAGAVLNVLPVEPGGSLAVLGAGPVGLAAIMAARSARATTIVAVDRVPARLEHAHALGSTHVIDSRTSRDLGRALRSIAARGFAAVLDSTGDPTLQRAGVDALATRGVLGIVGGGTEPGVPLGTLMVGGKSIRGIVQGDASGTGGLAQLLELHRAGRFPFERLVRRYPFERVNDAIEDSLNGQTVKPVLVFPGN